MEKEEVKIEFKKEKERNLKIPNLSPTELNSIKSKLNNSFKKEKEERESVFASFLLKLKETNSQMEKFEFLNDLIEKKVVENPLLTKFNSTIGSSLQDVFEFFNNRTKWKKVHDLVGYLQNQIESVIIENNNESKDLEVRVLL